MKSYREQLGEKLEAFTIHRGSTPKEAVAAIVIVPPASPIAEGFLLCEKLLSQYGSVRLVGLGVTLEREWPPWVRSARGLSLTELGAYACGTKAEVTRDLRAAIASWLDTIFAGVLPDASGVSLMKGTTCIRLLQPYFDAYPLVLGLVEAHPNAIFHSVDPTWVGMTLLSVMMPKARIAAASGDRQGWMATAIRRTRVAALFPLAAAGFAGSVLRFAKEWFSARSTFDELRRARTAASTPTTWVALVTDWERINRHVIESVALPTLASGRSLGILLIMGLGRGERAEANLKREGDALWSGLGVLSSRISECVIDQAVMPEALEDVAKSLVSAARSSAGAVIRIARRPYLALGSAHIDLTPHVWQLAKLATVDMINVHGVASATRALTKRHAFSGSSIVFAANSPVQMTTSDVLLQNVGATTYHLFHGTSADDWVGGAEHPSTFHCAWTHADARCMEALGRRTVVAGMPNRSPKGSEHRRSGRPKRILLMTGYAHRDNRDRYCFEPYQDELVAVLSLLRAHGLDDLELRWRPHPADRRERVEETFHRAQVAGLDLSVGQPFERDMAWADVVVTNLSSVVSESLLAGLPVFVHALPDLWLNPATSFIDPARLFFYAADGAAKIETFLARWPEAEGGFEPERAAMLSLWGPALRPLPFLALLESMSADAPDRSTARDASL